MDDLRLATVEHQFAEIVWAKAPITTRELVAVCLEQLNWQRTTTYTVLRKLCDRGLFVNEKSTVKVLITRDEYYAIQSERLIEEAFDGSLPAFIVAFASRKNLSEEKIQALKQALGALGKESQ